MSNQQIPPMSPDSRDWDLTDKDVDDLLERFDQTDRWTQRRVIVSYMIRATAFEERATRLEAALWQIVEAFEKRQVCRSVWREESARHCSECDERDAHAIVAARQALGEDVSL